MIARSGSVITDVILLHSMRYTIRQLLLTVFILGTILGGLSAWYRWYNHEISTHDLGNNFEVRFSSAYESWRGPRRVLRIDVYEKRKPLLDFTIRNMTYRGLENSPSVLFSKNGRYAYVSYPDGNGFLLADTVAGEFTSSFAIRAETLLLYSKNGGLSEIDEPWLSALESVEKNNPNSRITIR